MGRARGRTQLRPELSTLLLAAQAKRKRGDAWHLPDSAAHVQASAQLLARRDEGGQVSIIVDVDPGYHINTNPSSDPDLVATRLLTPGINHLEVRYPEAIWYRPPFSGHGIAVYTGQVKLLASWAGKAEPPSLLEVRVQACSDTQCLAPATLQVPLSAIPAHKPL